MAGKKTPLQQALEGKDLSERQAQGALSQAVSRIASLTKKANESKTCLAETGQQALHLAETQGSIFMSSMAEGFFGSEKLKVGGVDLRAPVGLVSAGYGLFQTLSGEAGGGHALAIGNGVMGSWLASVAVDAGKTLADKRNGVTQPQPQALPQPQPQPAMRGALPPPPAANNALFQLAQEAPMPVPTLRVSGPTREVLLSPAMPSTQGESEHSLDGPLQRHNRREERRDSRFPTARELDADA